MKFFMKWLRYQPIITKVEKINKLGPIRKTETEKRIEPEKKIDVIKGRLHIQKNDIKKGKKIIFIKFYRHCSRFLIVP